MKPLLLLTALAISACASEPRPVPAVDAGADTPLADTPPSDAPTADAGDVPAASDVASDAASDAAADVELRNGCPVLTDPVDRVGAPPNGDTYAAFATGFFRMWCVRCHSTTNVTPEARMGAPDGYNWDSEASVRMQLVRMRRAVGVDNYMPLTPPNPSCDERRRLIRWIDIGAP